MDGGSSNGLPVLIHDKDLQSELRTNGKVLAFEQLSAADVNLGNLGCVRFLGGGLLLIGIEGSAGGGLAFFQFDGGPKGHTPCASHSSTLFTCLRGITCGSGVKPVLVSTRVRVSCLILKHDKPSLPEEKPLAVGRTLDTVSFTEGFRISRWRQQEAEEHPGSDTGWWMCGRDQM